MKKRDLKKKITEAYKLETPDLQARVLEVCGKERQEPKPLPDMYNIFQEDERASFFVRFKRVAAVAVCIALFITGVLMGLFTLKNNGNFVSSDVETFVYIDVNPSIELQVDKKGKVVDAIAINEDAKTVLSELQLKGIDINTALRAIVGSMYVDGYLSENSNSVLISVNSNSDSASDAFLREITEQINFVFENSDMECSVIAQYFTVDEVLISNAREHGVSVGKMHLLNKIVSSFPHLTEDALYELSGLSINDLSLLYLQNKLEGGDGIYEIISGVASIGMTSDDALASVLTQIGKSEDEISSSCVYLRPSISGSSKVVYSVNINLPNDSKTYRYEVDCQSGEVFMVVRFATITSDGLAYKEILYSVSDADTE